MPSTLGCCPRPKMLPSLGDSDLQAKQLGRDSPQDTTAGLGLSDLLLEGTDRCQGHFPHPCVILESAKHTREHWTCFPQSGWSLFFLVLVNTHA